MRFSYAKLFGFLILITVFAVSACGSGQAPQQAAPEGGSAGAAPSTISPAARAEAQQVFATRCTPCHGAEGKGDGPASKGLTPPPRDYTLAEWQKSVTDEHIEKIVMYGGAAVGKSPMMPPNPDLVAKPEVVKALREHVRSLGK
ncbi:cytochrome c [bacterium]|nr:cytochrome c [bacterium]